MLQSLDMFGPCGAGSGEQNPAPSGGGREQLRLRRLEPGGDVGGVFCLAQTS